MLALNLETVKPANFTTVNGESLPLFKSRYTSNLSPVHVSDRMTGKMTGIPAISTSCLENPICRARMENGESVCAHCFAAATLDRYTAAGMHAANNLQILTWQVLPLDLLPRFRNVAIVRIESFGDVANVTQARNYLNICRVNPFITFAAWTKNASIWNEAIALDGKPENLSLVYSSFKLNIPASPDDISPPPAKTTSIIFSPSSTKGPRIFTATVSSTAARVIAQPAAGATERTLMSLT